MKVAVKQAFDAVDAVIFEAALVLNAIDTQYKQKEYVSWCGSRKLAAKHFKVDFLVNCLFLGNNFSFHS